MGWPPSPQSEGDGYFPSQLERDSDSPPQCERAVDFVALIGYRTQALTVKRLAGRCGPIPTSMI